MVQSTRRGVQRIAAEHQQIRPEGEPCLALGGELRVVRRLAETPLPLALGQLVAKIREVSPLQQGARRRAALRTQVRCLAEKPAREVEPWAATAVAWQVEASWSAVVRQQVAMLLEAEPLVATPTPPVNPVAETRQQEAGPLEEALGLPAQPLAGNPLAALRQREVERQVALLRATRALPATRATRASPATRASLVREEPSSPGVGRWYGHALHSSHRSDGRWSRYRSDPAPATPSRDKSVAHRSSA